MLTLRMPWLALLISALPLAGAQAFEGTVTRVTDGDTVWVQPAEPGRRRVKLRLEGIDAPETCQPWGPQAAAALRQRVLGRVVQVPEQGHDRYGRALGDLMLGPEDVGAWMVSQGHAWSYRVHGESGRYDREEAQARESARGLFSQADPMRPYVFRRVHGACAIPEGRGR
jgi:micrococcal nuclease